MKANFTNALTRITQMKTEWEQRSKGEPDVQKESRADLLHYGAKERLRHLFVAPLIYFMAIPIFLFDISVSIYQHIAFRAYEIPLVKRGDYIIIDRNRLGYLDPLDKFNCVYCGYGNGVAAYAKEIIARTEQYWCPIKHAKYIKDAHSRYHNFFEYGDVESYRENLADVILKYDDENEQ